MTKEEFKSKALLCIKQSVDTMEIDLERLMRSGSLDIETADMIEVKAVVTHLLEKESRQFIPKGTSHMERFMETKDNAACFV